MIMKKLLAIIMARLRESRHFIWSIFHASEIAFLNLF